MAVAQDVSLRLVRLHKGTVDDAPPFEERLTSIRVYAVTPLWHAGRSPTPLADLQRHQVEDLIGCGVRSMDLYRAALSSKSAVEPDQIIARSFDRLEFLGDAVVGQVFKDYIFQR